MDYIPILDYQRKIIGSVILKDAERGTVQLIEEARKLPGNLHPAFRGDELVEFVWGPEASAMSVPARHDSVVTWVQGKKEFADYSTTMHITTFTFVSMVI